MKIWEAIQMLQQMDQTKECTVTFGQPTKVMEHGYMHDYAVNRTQWVDRSAPSPNTVTCKNVH